MGKYFPGFADLVFCFLLLPAAGYSQGEFTPKSLQHFAVTSLPQSSANINSLSEKRLNEIAAMLGTEPDSALMKKITGVDGKNYQEQGPNPPDAKLETIKHIRGAKGRKLPNVEETLNSIHLDIDLHGMETMAKDLVDTQVEGAKKEFIVQPLPRCASAETQMIDRVYFKKKDAKKVETDLLFVEEGKAPIDPEVLYGEKVMLREYTPEKPDAFTYMAKTLGIECLPYRYRVTGRYLYLHKGEDALKRYE